MERLTFASHNRWRKKLNRISTVFISIALGVAPLMFLLSQLEIEFSFEGYRGSLIGGLVKTWNAICDAFGKTHYIIMNKYAGEGEGNTLFLCLCFLFGSFIAYMILKSKNKWALLFFIIPQVAISLVFNMYGNMWYAMLWIISVVMGILHIEKDGDILNSAIVFGLIIIAVAIIAQTNIYNSVTENAVFAKLRGDLQSSKEKLLYGENILKNGDMNQKTRSRSDDTAIVLSMEKPHPMYLKGFIGDVFDGEAWKEIPNFQYYSYYGFNEGLKKRRFEGFRQLSNAAKITEEQETYTDVKVDIKEADSRFAYIPYDISHMGDLQNYNQKGSSKLSKPFWRGFKSYSFKTDSTDRVTMWTEIAAKLFSVADKEENREERTKYLESESWFNQYVYEHFIFVSDVDKTLIENELGGAGNRINGHVNYKIAINKIRDYLKNNFSYVENPKEMKGAVNKLESFLNIKEGFDTHYATAATLMFRYYGIPARYVEGYIVTKDDIKNAKNPQNIEISKNQNHAWVEIYVDGLGFVPIEVSPPYREIMDEADMTIGISNDSIEKQFEESFDVSQAIQKVLPPDKKEEKKSDKISLITLLIIFLLLVLSAILIMILYRKMRICIARRRLFYKAEPKRAVCGIYQYMDDCGLNMSDEIVRIGDKAAYSREAIGEECRTFMLGKLKELKKERKNHGRRFNFKKRKNK